VILKVAGGLVVVLFALALIGRVADGGESGEVEQAVADYYAPDVLVVEDSCSQRGETTSGYERWVCVVQGPGSEFERGPADEVDVAWNGSKIVRVER
jgi:hypothetical protein